MPIKCLNEIPIALIWRHKTIFCWCHHWLGKVRQIHCALLVNGCLLMLLVIILIEVGCCPRCSSNTDVAHVGLCTISCVIDACAHRHTAILLINTLSIKWLFLSVFTFISGWVRRCQYLLICHIGTLGSHFSRSNLLSIFHINLQILSLLNSEFIATSVECVSHFQILNFFLYFIWKFKGAV